jgi:hypothetical protein
MPDDWRVTATMRESGLVEPLLDRLARHEVEDEVVDRLGGRVVVTTGPSHVFVYADTEGAAREAEHILRELCEAHELDAEFAVDRWHPLEERWEDATVPLPRTEAERRAEHEVLEQDEAVESQRTGLAEWEVRIELESRHDAVELADRLEAEGLEPVRRWSYVVVGTSNEDQARELAARLRAELPAGATVAVEAGPAMWAEAPASTQFVSWFT